MFVLLGIVLAASLAVAYATGGRVEALSSLRVRGAPLLAPALLLGLLPVFVGLPSGLERTVVVVANLLVAGVLLSNVARRGPARAGFAILLAGWVLNAVPIALNGGMPLSLWAYERSGQTDPVTPGEGGFFKIVVADESTRVRFLGDAIPIRAVGQVVSVGDIALALGIGVVVAGGMRGADRRAGGRRGAGLGDENGAFAPPQLPRDR